ncbi:hypothetical protein AGMMS50229_13000 [Campylobacterota bacterium]|nr:hypothetical protein AGMMS50229_13000 [Campylobacterota bacterium]
MRNIVIVGAGGFALELYHYVLESDLVRWGEWQFKGFTALSNDSTIAEYGLSRYFLGSYETTEFAPEDSFLIGIGVPKIRRKIYEQFAALGRDLPNFVANGARVNLAALAGGGRGNIFCPQSGGYFAKIGAGNLFNLFSAVGHDATLGSFNVLSSFCDITGHCVVGDSNFFGSHAAMLPSSKIGNENKISAGSIVYKGCGDRVVLHGNPARTFGAVEEA